MKRIKFACLTGFLSRHCLSILRERLPAVDVDDDGAKYRNIIRGLIQRDDGTYDRELALVVRKLSQMARLTLTDYRDAEQRQKFADFVGTTKDVCRKLDYPYLAMVKGENQNDLRRRAPKRAKSTLQQLVPHVQQR